MLGNLRERIKLRRKRLFILLLLAIIVGSIFAFRNKNKGVAATKVKLENTVVSSSVSASGTIVSVNDANLSFYAVGNITNIAVNEGDSVTRGQLIAQLYNADTRQTIQATKDARDVAIKDKELYIENFATNVNAAGGEDEYYLSLRRHDELISKAEATYQAALLGLRNSFIYAPFDGTVVDVLSDVGDAATLGQDIIKVADLSTLTFEVLLDQEDFGLVSLGQSVEIILDAYETQIIKGTITKLPYYADPDGDLKITISFDYNEDGVLPYSLLLGMTGDAEILVDQKTQPVNSLTFDLIYSDATGDFVWIVHDNLLQKKYIEIGLEGNIYTEVLTDLSEYTIVIPKGDAEFEEGLSVTFSEE